METNLRTVTTHIDFNNRVWLSIEELAILLGYKKGSELLDDLKSMKLCKIDVRENDNKYITKDFICIGNIGKLIKLNKGEE